MVTAKSLLIFKRLFGRISIIFVKPVFAKEIHDCFNQIFPVKPKMATDESIEEFRESFLLYDRRGDRRIESSQIGEVLRALGTNPTELEVRKIIRNLDSGRTTTKRVSFEEFYPVLQALRERERRDNRGIYSGFFFCEF